MLPTGPVTLKLTLFVLALAYMWVTWDNVVFVLEPSPKFHVRFVIVPVELSLNKTDRGHEPLVGTPVKAATGTSAPVPITELVMFPSLGIVKVTKLVKLPVLGGVNLTTKLVEPNPGRVNGDPEVIVNGPEFTEAIPLLRVEPPWFVSRKLA